MGIRHLHGRRSTSQLYIPLWNSEVSSYMKLKVRLSKYSVHLSELTFVAAIWRFTLYWTILLVCSLFLICALMASFTLLLSLTVFRSPDPLLPVPKPHDSRSNETPPYRTTSPNTGVSATSSFTPLVKHPRPFERPKRKKPPFWPVILLPIVMAVVAGIVSIISSTIIGFALAAVYSSGGFSMST